MIVSKLIKVATAGLLTPVLFFAFALIPAGASPKVSVLAFGLFGAQSVFESEAKGAAGIVAHQLDANAVVVRSNTKTRGDVTIASIEDGLQSVAERMDRENDLLFLILTSHGSQAGIAVQAGRREEILSPAALAGMLNRAGVRHRVVVISACYSGVFIRPLANDDTLVITPETTADDIPRWDSFNHINIIVGTEMRFGLRFQTAEVEALKNVGELVKLIAAKSGRNSMA